MNRFGQTLGGNTYKIAGGDAESVISDLTAYDDEDLEDSLASSIATKGSSKKSSNKSGVFSRGTLIGQSYMDSIPPRSDESVKTGNVSEWFEITPVPRKRKGGK